MMGRIDCGMDPLPYALEVAACVSERRPVKEADRALGAGWSPEKVPDFPRELMSIDPFTAYDDHETRAALAKHAGEVAAVEARNAGRLQTLLWSVQIMNDNGMGDAAHELLTFVLARYPGVQRMLRTFDRWTHADARRMAKPACQDLLSLPKEWRRALQ